MSSYESFARVYDLFMDNIPYEEWCGYLTGLLEDQGSGMDWSWSWAAGQEI